MCDMIKDYLYLETDDTCALCGQRGKDNLTEHHIDGNSNNNAYDNRIILCHNCHHRYENDKGITKDDIEERKRRLIKKTLTQYGVNAIKIAARNNMGVVSMSFLMHHLVGLGFMKQEKQIMSYGKQGQKVDMDVLFSITDAGKRFYNKWLKD